MVRASLEAALAYWAAMSPTSPYDIKRQAVLHMPRSHIDDNPNRFSQGVLLGVCFLWKYASIVIINDIHRDMNPPLPFF